MAGIGQVRRMAPGEEEGGTVVDAQATPVDGGEAVADDGEQPNVSPEEQAQYDDFVHNAMRLIYKDNRVNPPILQQLNGQWDDLKPSLGELPPDEKLLDPTNPSDNLAVTTVGVVLALEASAAQAERQLDPSVVFHGAVEVLEQLADISAAGKIHDYNVDELTGAGNRTALIYGVSSKTANKQEALAEFQHFLETSGPGLEEQFASMGPQDGAAPADPSAQSTAPVPGGA